MLFHPEEFRKSVSESNPKSLLTILSKLIYSLRHSTEPLFLFRMTEEIVSIIKSQSESPILKFKIAKMLMYLIIMANPQVMQVVTDQIYPLIRNACLFNRFHPLITRGIDFFRNNKYYEIATFDEKTKIKNIGCKYIMFCLQYVYILAQWLPNDKTSDLESIFLSSYKMLLKQGVIFPHPNELTFFSEDRIQKIQQELQGCSSEANEIKSKFDQQYFDSDRNKFDAAMMNGVEYLQKKLLQKQKIISEMKYNNSINELNQQSVIVKLQQQENNHTNRVEYYQKKITALTQEVRQMKTMMNTEQRSPVKQTIEKGKMASLEAQIQLLNYQNSQLKEQLARKSSIMSNPLKNIESRDENTTQKLKHKDYQHIKELLQISDQYQESDPKSPLKQNHQKQQFYSFKNLKSAFSPLYDLLTPQLQIRFRKCLIKSKQILFKNQLLEIGFISSLKNEFEIEMTLIFTNLSEKHLFIDINFNFTKEVPVVHNASNGGRKKLKEGYQFKEEIKIIVNLIDAKCPTLTVNYQKQQGSLQNIFLLLPVSKIKLIQTFNYTSHSLKQWQSMERVFQFDKMIMSNVSKLNSYFPKCFVENKGGWKELSIKMKFLQAIFYTKFSGISEQYLRITIEFKRQSKCLAEKLLDEFSFILSK